MRLHECADSFHATSVTDLSAALYLHIYIAELTIYRSISFHFMELVLTIIVFLRNYQA